MKLTKERLEKLRALKQELNTLEYNYITMPTSEYVGDTAGDYRTGQKRIIRIQGVTDAKYRELGDKIAIKSQRLANEIIALEEFLDGVDDSVMRDILRLYYAEGRTLEEVGKKKGYTPSAIYYKIKNFFGDIDDDSKKSK